MPPSDYRSSITTQGRRMAGARALWRATGMKTEDFLKPVVAIANSFTQFVPGHVHLHPIGQRVKQVVDAAGGYGVEFNTIAVDDGIAMGHDGMLYSLPSLELIADSVEYMVNAHKADALVCISTPWSPPATTASPTRSWRRWRPPPAPPAAPARACSRPTP